MFLLYMPDAFTVFAWWAAYVYCCVSCTGLSTFCWTWFLFVLLVAWPWVESSRWLGFDLVPCPFFLVCLHIWLHLSMNLHLSSFLYQALWCMYVHPCTCISWSCYVACCVEYYFVHLASPLCIFAWTVACCLPYCLVSMCCIHVWLIHLWTADLCTVLLLHWLTRPWVESSRWLGFDLLPCPFLWEFSIVHEIKNGKRPYDICSDTLCISQVVRANIWSLSEKNMKRNNPNTWGK